MMNKLKYLIELEQCCMILQKKMTYILVQWATSYFNLLPDF